MKMKKLLSVLAFGAAITIPAVVAAKPVTFTTTLRNYRGPGAYLALYVVDSNDVYKGTLWMSGGKTKYYKHLSGWKRATRGDLAQVRGVTGASIGAGRTLEVTLDLADALFDAGYKLHIDAAVEDRRDSPSDVVIALTRANIGKSVRGKSFVGNFSFK